VPVGLEISRTLEAPLDIFIVRKLGAPEQAELGIGAVAQGGTRVLNERILEYLQVSEEYLDRVTRREQAEVERRLKLLRGGLPSPEMRDRTVILVDDGLATGVTAMAAVAAIREYEPRKIVLAVPVCAAQTAETMDREVDGFVSLEAPASLQAIGFWYENFEQVSDDEVILLLKTARQEQAL
jgi:predicted phosphoribosyltransferase